MKKEFKNLLLLVLTTAIILSSCIFSVSAAGTSIAISNKNATIGDNVTITVTVNPGEKMYGVELNFVYNSDVLEYISGNAVGGAGILRLVESPSGDTSISYNFTFKALNAGTSTLKITDCAYRILGENGATPKSLTGSETSLTVKSVALSGNADLKSLSLSAGTLSPKFSPSRTSYSVNVPNSVTECKVYATTADSNAKFTVQGSATLKIGKNTRTIVVTAPNGTQKTYTINITRSETEVTSSPETNTDNPSTEQPSDDNPLQVDVNGVIYSVATDISSAKLFAGFVAGTDKFNDIDVAVATDEKNNFKIYYLIQSDSQELFPFTYNEEDKAFEKLQYLSLNDTDYILADIPENYDLPSNYYKTNTTISGLTVKCYGNTDEKLNDFCYLYCFKDGNYGFYRYDKIENVFQRYPELELVRVESNIKPNDNNQVNEPNIMNRFLDLTTNAKVIIIGLLFVFLLTITLIILLVIKLFRKNPNEFDDFSEDMDFENINVISDFSLVNNNENIETDTEDLEEEIIENNSED